MNAVQNKHDLLEDIETMRDFLTALPSIDSLRTNKLGDHITFILNELDTITLAQAKKGLADHLVFSLFIFDIDATLTPPHAPAKSLRSHAMKGIPAVMQDHIDAHRTKAIPMETLETLTRNIERYVGKLIDSEVENVVRVLIEARNHSPHFSLYILSRNNRLVSEIYLRLLLAKYDFQASELFDFKRSRFRHHHTKRCNDKGYQMIEMLRHVRDKAASTPAASHEEEDVKEQIPRRLDVGFPFRVRMVFFDDGLYNLQSAYLSSIAFRHATYFVPFYVPAYEVRYRQWLGDADAAVEAIEVIADPYRLPSRQFSKPIPELERLVLK